LRANIPAVMPHYRLFLYNQHSRVRYPGTFNLPNVDAARAVGLRVAQIFMQVVPYWRDLSADQREDSVVEIIDEVRSHCRG
jgi:hypothetical protein